MKKSLKVAYATIGLLVVLSVAFTSTATASTGTKMLQAAFNNIKIVIDGNVVTPKDGKGNIVEPFVVDGTTYLPVRAIAEALGKDVSWDGNTNTVIIGKSPSSPAPTSSTSGSVKLSSLEYLTRAGNHDFEHKEQERANTGNYYNDCLLYLVGQGVSTRDYLINGQYKKMSGTIFVEYESRAYEAIGKFSVWGDSKLLYSSEEIKAGFMPKEFNIDISNVSVLKVGFEEIGPNTALVIGVSETTLHK